MEPDLPVALKLFKVKKRLDASGVAMVCRGISITLMTALVTTVLSHHPTAAWAVVELPGLVAPQEVTDLLQIRLRSPQVTGNTPSPTAYTAPSLWLTNQLHGDKLILEWLAYRRLQDNKSQVRLIVRSDLWRRYTYLERYSFLRNFGEATSAVGYQLLVLDRQSFPLAAHTCSFSPETRPLSTYPFRTSQTPPTLLAQPRVPCKLWMNPIYNAPAF
jgi:hypothetical protein